MLLGLARKDKEHSHKQQQQNRSEKCIENNKKLAFKQVQQQSDFDDIWRKVRHFWTLE